MEVLSKILQDLAQVLLKTLEVIPVEMTVNGKGDIQTKVMVSTFGLFAEVERDLLSERTKMGLANAKAKGKKLGRPVGRLG